MAHCRSMCLSHLSPRVLSSSSISSSTDLSSLSVVNISSHFSFITTTEPPPPPPSSFLPSFLQFVSSIWSFGFLSSMVSSLRITSLIYNDGSSFRREAGVVEGGGGGGGGGFFSFGFLNQTDESKELEEGVFYALCASYTLIAFIALVQLFRIQMRVPEYGWTTQKVFHLMNFIVNGLRAILFGFYKSVFLLRPKVLEMALLDLPSLLFFSTYTLLVLFWAEIYHQARSLPITKLRPAYLTINGVVYIIQVCIWIAIKLSRDHVAVEVAKLFLSVISFFAALGFLIYGGRLFYLLRRFPIESKGRRNKLNEVGFVTGICCTCFLIRCIVVAVSAFDKDVDLDVLNHPILNLMYYMLVEIVPSALVLFILRKLPPKRISEQYHPIR